MHAPTPPAGSLLGHARVFQRDPLGFLVETARALGPVVRLRLGPLTYHLVTGAAAVATVLTERPGNYLRDTRSSRTIRLVTGESLLTTEGEPWRRQRRLAQPIFHPQRIAELLAHLQGTVDQVATEWETLARDGRPIDLAAEMSRLAFRAVGRCLFGAELGAQARTVEHALPVLLEELFRRSQQVVSWPIWLPLHRHQEFRRARGAIDAIVQQLIESRRGASAGRTDLLSLLLEARDEAGERLTDAELRNHTVAFVLAGHDTTASTLTWTLSLLDQYPAERDRLERELDGATPMPTGGVAGTLTPVLDAVLRESLRLYPSIWIAERRVADDDVLGGYKIPRGTAVVLSAYATHRLAAYWPNPDAFDPKRFREGNPMPTVQDGYFPFGAGPHSCIGQHFALLEIRTVLTTLLRRFRVRLPQGFPAVQGGITLRPRATVPARLELR